MECSISRMTSCVELGVLSIDARAITPASRGSSSRKRRRGSGADTNFGHVMSGADPCITEKAVIDVPFCSCTLWEKVWWSEGAPVARFAA